MSEDVRVRAEVDPDPRPPVSPGWTARFAIASTGMWLAFLTPAQVQLAIQAELFAPEGKETLLGIATGVGAAVTAVAVPAFGAVSDRTRSRWGRRRPWVGGGIVVAAAGLAWLAAAQGSLSLVLGWVLTQLGLSAVQAGLVATIPDRVPRPQLGAVAGWAGMTQMFGALLGTVLVNLVITDLAPGYLACAAVAVLAVVPFLIGYREPVDVPMPAPVAVAVARKKRPSVEITPDIAWAWVSRFLITLGWSLVTQYLLYYLDDALELDDPQRGVLVLTVVTVLGSMIAALVTGRWSDRVQRRKVFVTAAGLGIGAGALALALVPAWPVTIAAACVMGLGFGTFLAVDLAVITSVLPSAADTGRDLGVFAIAFAVPQILAPVLAVPVLAASGYRGLYLVTAFVTILGGLFVQRVRSVR